MRTVPTQNPLLTAIAGILVLGVLLLPIAIVVTLVVLVVSGRRSGPTAERVNRGSLIALILEVVLVVLAAWWMSVDPGWTF